MMAVGGGWEANYDGLAAERDRFKELWDGTRPTAERLRTALEEVRRIASYHTAKDEQISAIFDVAHGALSDIDLNTLRQPVEGEGFWPAPTTERGGH